MLQDIPLRVNFVFMLLTKLSKISYSLFVTGIYAGEKIPEKKYKAMEKRGQESGYAWKVNGEDGAYFIDGKDPAKSNWLRFINCCRYRQEENVEIRIRRG